MMPWAPLALALALTLVLVPLGRALWVRLGRRDAERSLRKVHAGEVPRVGGAAVLLAVCGAAGVALAGGAWAGAGSVGAALAGAALLGLAGLADDLVGLRARAKLALQVAVAVAVVWAGVRWPALEALFDRNWVSASLTVGFLVLATNAVNLIDGLDGLAGGVLFSGFAVIVGASALGAADPAAGWVAAAALGATLGFLAFNRHPARVFLGDGGAFFLGFLLAALLLLVGSVRPRKALVELSMPLMALALPLLDTTLAIVRRAVRGQPIFASDADHVHHRLLARGFSTWEAVGVLWAVQGWFAVMAYLTVRGVGGAWTLAGAVATSALVPVLLGYHRHVRLAGGPGPEAGWLARRKETVALLRRVEALGRGGPGDRGPERWRRLAPALVPVLDALGFVGFEIRAGGERVVSAGNVEAVRAWLDVPLAEDVELRLPLTGQLTALFPAAQQHVLERVLDLLMGRSGDGLRGGSGDDHPAARVPGPAQVN